MIRLTGLRLEESADGTQVRLCAELGRDGKVKPLWLSLDARYRDYLATDRYDAFLTAALLHAMALGEDIAVDGPVSERLCFAYRHNLGPAIALLNPALQAVDICVESFAPPLPAGDAVGIGYSGGVDSMHALLRLLEEGIEPSFRPTHLLFTNVGTHGNSFYGDIVRSRELFHERLRRIEDFAQEIGLPVIAVDSNWHEQLSWQPLNHVFIFNVAVAQVLQAGLGKFHFPNQADLLSIPSWAPGDLVIYQPALLPWCSTDGLSCLPVDGCYSRVEKTAFLAKQPLAWKYLDVCVTHYGANGRNCVTGCAKCRRTAVAMDVLDQLEHFGGVFDLDKYARHRTRLMRGILASAGSDDYAGELVAYARNAGFKWPVAVTAGAAAKRAERRIRRWLKPAWPLFRALRGKKRAART